MLGNKSKAKEVEEKDHDHEDKSEVLGNLVKVVVLIWSASLLTFSYVAFREWPLLLSTLTH